MQFKTTASLVAATALLTTGPVANADEDLYGVPSAPGPFVTHEMLSNWRPARLAEYLGHDHSAARRAERVTVESVGPAYGIHFYAPPAPTSVAGICRSRAFNIFATTAAGGYDTYRGAFAASEPKEVFLLSAKGPCRNAQGQLVYAPSARTLRRVMHLLSGTVEEAKGDGSLSFELACGSGAPCDDPRRRLAETPVNAIRRVTPAFCRDLNDCYSIEVAVPEGEGTRYWRIELRARRTVDRVEISSEMVLPLSTDDIAGLRERLAGAVPPAYGTGDLP